MIISFINQKGGVGRTTLATHLAGEIAAHGDSVMVIDADPQGSVLDWSERRRRMGLPKLFGVVGIARETLHIECRAIARGVDHVIIDAPPRVTALTRCALLASDVALIPIQPSPYDVLGSQQAIDLTTEVQIQRPMMYPAFVVNRRVVGTSIGRHLAPSMWRWPYPTLQSQVHQRIAFAQCGVVGCLVQEFAYGSPAAAEISALTEEVLELKPCDRDR